MAVDKDQKPPIVMPSSARAAIKNMKFGATAMSTSDASIRAVNAASTWRRSNRLATVAMNRLVATANNPDMDIACPDMPSVAPKSAAIGVSKLTGMNSEAMSKATHIVMEPTALHAPRSTLEGEVWSVFTKLS